MARSKDKLRLLTLNTHSLMEEDNAFCLRTLADAIVREDVDVVALQEVNQSADAREAEAERLRASRFVPCESEAPIRADNFALTLSELLGESGAPFYWTWAYAHRGYRVYEEGVALLSRAPVTGVDAVCVSTPKGRCRRKIAGIRTQALCGDGWFYSVHMGWWKDEEDPFAGQWARFVQSRGERLESAYLMGDFNSPAHVRGEGYDLVVASGWEDCFLRAAERDAGATVGGQIDGWRKEKVDPMRIDFAFAAQPGATRSSRVIFNGDFYPVISDHYGVLTEDGR